MGWEGASVLVFTKDCFNTNANEVVHNWSLFLPPRFSNKKPNPRNLQAFHHPQYTGGPSGSLQTPPENLTMTPPGSSDGGALTTQKAQKKARGQEPHCVLQRIAKEKSVLFVEVNLRHNGRNE